MNTLLVCVSVSNGNTATVAAALADVLDARVIEPEQLDADALRDIDLVGFGSGVYGMALHERLYRGIDELPDVDNIPAFLFATSGLPELPLLGWFRPLRKRLNAKGFDVRGAFRCPGYDRWLPLRLIGGINNGHPNDADLDAAREFATALRDRIANPGLDLDLAAAGTGTAPTFEFRGAYGTATGTIVTGRDAFVDAIRTCSADSIRHHAYHHDLSRWIGDALDDPDTAAAVAAIEDDVNAGGDHAPIEDLRGRLLRILAGADV